MATALGAVRGIRGGDIVQLPKMFGICVNYLIKRLNFGRIGDGDEAPTLELKPELRAIKRAAR